MRAKLNIVLASVLGSVLMVSGGSSQEINPLAMFSGQTGYSGMPLEMPRLDTTRLDVEGFFETFDATLFNSALSRGYVIRSKEELADFVASFPTWTCRDCPPQALATADIDFSSTLIVVVVRSEMYVHPRIRKVLWGKDEIEVHYDLPPLGKTVGYSRVSDVGTYSAAVIPLTRRPIEFIEEEWTAE